MPRNDCRKANKNKTPIKASYAKADAESSVLNWQKIISVRELKIKYISHTKGHYGIEDPELQFSKKGMQEDSYEKGQKSKSTKSAKNGIGMRNKRIFLFTMCYNPMVSKLLATWRQR